MRAGGCGSGCGRCLEHLELNADARAAGRTSSPEPASRLVSLTVDRVEVTITAAVVDVVGAVQRDPFDRDLGRRPAGRLGRP
jgi:hypothetical protein